MTSEAAAMLGRNARNRSGSWVGRPSRGSRACRCTMAAPAFAAPTALPAISSAVTGRCGDMVGVWMAPVTAHVMIALRRKPRLRQAPNAEAGDFEQAPGQELRPGFLREQIVDRGMFDAGHRRHVELVEMVAAEHAAGDVANRHADTAFDGSVRRIANEIAGDELRVPHAAVLVYRRAVGHARIVREHTEDPLVRERSGG